MKISLIGAAMCLALSGTGFGEEYQGAEAVLKKAAAAYEKPTAPAPNADTPVKLKHELKAFRQNIANLQPAEAAKQWLQFVDRFVNLPIDRDAIGWFGSGADDPDSNWISFQQVAEALPPASAWDALAQALEKRAPDKQDIARTVVLRAMAHWLVSNNAAVKKDLEELESQPTTAQMLYPMNELAWALVKNLDDTGAILTSLEQRVERDAKAQYPMRVQVPDLVSLVGEEKAISLLRDILRKEKGEIAVDRGAATTKLARKLALELVNELKAPQWGLANSLDATALYEGMAKRFAETDRDRYARAQAQSYYLLGLIAAHRAGDAAAFASKLAGPGAWSLPYGALSTMERSGYTRDLAEFFHDVLQKNPDLPFWNEYVQLAAKAGEADKMVTLAESSAARSGLTPKQRRTILTHLYRAYLAADKIDQAIEVLRQAIVLDKSPNSKQNPADQDNVYYTYGSEEDDAGLALIRIGDALKRKEWIEEGVRAVREGTVDTNDVRDKEKRARRLNNLATELMALNRGREAEEVLSEALTLAPDPAKQQTSTPSQPETLALLLNLYDRAGRPDDVLALLAQAPLWNAKDLANIFAKTVSNGPHDADYLGLFAADALLRKGRDVDSKRIVDALLEQHGGYDPAYEYLIKLDGEKAIGHLDQLFAHDQFEERPLIWKAKLLFDADKLEEAEKCARQAIAIDPSDGEQGPGRRMRAYAVLADIRERRGDSKEAEILRGAVTAIRHSEEADRFYAAGLLTRAVKIYQEALGHFADAYCIQSRLALRMAELGDMAGAEEHYRRAYELMPDSFGRVESHCFGCERAFDGERAQSIAEKVFTELAAKRPEKPQIHYLLGYLRNVEERYAGSEIGSRVFKRLERVGWSRWEDLSAAERTRSNSAHCVAPGSAQASLLVSDQ
jgi:tetratricopeptide (TPR) repeat protein